MSEATFHPAVPTPHSGEVTTVDRSGTKTLAELANRFLAAKDRKPRIVLHDVIADAVKKAMQTARVARKGLGVYGLRRSFETIGAETGDQVAIDHVMAPVPLMSAAYR